MFHSVAPSVTADGQAQQQLQHIAPRPPRYPNDEDLGPNSSQPQQQEQQEQQQSTSHFIEVKSETGSEPFKIQSARGTPKGPLPIDVQLKLLTSVLKHDPFNCAIRKTTQAWESISREQGIRARTCSRRFDNIIQASIARRDRPVGTPEQQAEKKQLLEKLLEMMNRPQALKRMQKKRRYRSEETDRRLLQETIRLNPFAQKVGQVAKAWEDVRDALKMKVHARQCIRRVNRMVKPYQLRERMYKGNIPDEMKETNDDLVKQVIQLMNSSGLNQSLDDHSNDEDGVSDSEDQEDPFMDGKDRDNAQEDDELEDDEDDDMVSASESENNPASKIDGVQQQSVAVTGSPPALVVSPTSTQPTTSSSTSTQPTTSSSASTTSGPSTSSVVPTPAKRGRPRNNQNTAPQITEKTRKRLSTGSDTKMEIEMVDSKSLQQQQQPLSHDGPSLDTDLAAASASVEPRYPGQRALSHTATLSPPHPVYSPPGPHSQGPVNDHLYPPPPQASYQHMDYRRPLKHVRSDSRGEYDTVSHPTREMEESNYRHGAYAGRGQQSIGPQNHPDQSREPVMDGYPRHVGGGYHASAASAGVPGNNFDEGHEGIPPPSSQNLREVLGELRYIQDRLAQMEEQKRDDSKKQASMRYLIDKLQHQVQVQQKQLYDLQNQLRYGYPTSPSQQKQQNQGALGGGPVSPPPHHYHEQRHSSPLQGSLGTTPSSSSGGAPPLPPSSTARYSEHHNNAAPYQMNVPGRSSMEHPHQDIPHHSSSYSRSDVQYHRDR
ncbi:hypothetical protein BGZ46_004307 [Entomortierella lignicola]|nr:hypothetical protein BGZ46_004307 [Entomortierella lignicola]